MTITIILINIINTKAFVGPLVGAVFHAMDVYIYIYREREREMCISIYLYLSPYVHTYIFICVYIYICRIHISGLRQLQVALRGAGQRPRDNPLKNLFLIVYYVLYIYFVYMRSEGGHNIFQHNKTTHTHTHTPVQFFRKWDPTHNNKSYFYMSFLIQTYCTMKIRCLTKNDIYVCGLGFIS